MIRKCRGWGKVFDKLLSWIWKSFGVSWEKGRENVFWKNRVVSERYRASWSKELPSHHGADEKVKLKMDEEPGAQPQWACEMCWQAQNFSKEWGGCTSEGFKIGGCHDQNCILERSRWMLYGDLEFFPWVSLILWKIYFISAEIWQWYLRARLPAHLLLLIFSKSGGITETSQQIGNSSSFPGTISGAEGGMVRSMQWWQNVHLIHGCHFCKTPGMKLNSSFIWLLLVIIIICCLSYFSSFH